jgi:hypothetical protein
MDITTQLRACGIAAGPLFLVVWAGQAFIRDGFEPSRHPISLLALGGAGRIQIANFVVSGTFFVAAAVGLRHQGRWLPRFVGAFGVGLILAGVFVTDPGAGFPVGAPEGRGEVSWHGVLHEVGFERRPARDADRSAPTQASASVAGRLIGREQDAPRTPRPRLGELGSPTEVVLHPVVTGHGTFPRHINPG